MCVDTGLNTLEHFSHATIEIVNRFTKCIQVVLEDCRKHSQQHNPRQRLGYTIVSSVTGKLSKRFNFRNAMGSLNAVWDNYKNLPILGEIKVKYACRVVRFQSLSGFHDNPTEAETLNTNTRTCAAPDLLRQRFDKLLFQWLLIKHRNRTRDGQAELRTRAQSNMFRSSGLHLNLKSVADSDRIGISLREK